MKKTTLYLSAGLLFAVLFQACSPKLSTTLSYRTQPVKIDGKMDEWSIPLDFYNKETRVNYSVANDDANIYYCIKVLDVFTQMKMMRAGFKICIDSTGKKKKPVTITYPMAHPMPVSQIRSNNTKSENWMLEQMLLKQRQMDLSGFKSGNGLSPLSNKGIQVAAAFDSSGVLIYEGKIPFSSFYKEKLDASDSNRVWKLGIILQGVPFEGGSNYANGGAPMGGGMNGGMNGGMQQGQMAGQLMRNAPASAQANGRSEINETRAIWQEVRFSRSK
jgi:hypothetical protein